MFLKISKSFRYFLVILACSYIFSLFYQKSFSTSSFSISQLFHKWFFYQTFSGFIIGLDLKSNSFEGKYFVNMNIVYLRYMQLAYYKTKHILYSSAWPGEFLFLNIQIFCHWDIQGIYDWFKFWPELFCRISSECVGLVESQMMGSWPSLLGQFRAIIIDDPDNIVRHHWWI